MAIYVLGISAFYHDSAAAFQCGCKGRRSMTFPQFTQARAGSRQSFSACRFHRYYSLMGNRRCR